MRTVIFNRYTLSIGIAATLLVGCASQPPIGAPIGAPPETASHRSTSAIYNQLFQFRRPINGAHPKRGSYLT